MYEYVGSCGQLELAGAKPIRDIHLNIDIHVHAAETSLVDLHFY